MDQVPVSLGILHRIWRYDIHFTLISKLYFHGVRRVGKFAPLVVRIVIVYGILGEDTMNKPEAEEYE